MESLCPICTEGKEEIRLSTCGHAACLSCASAWTESRVGDGVVAIRCWGHGCNAKLEHETVSRLLSDRPSVLERYEFLALKEVLSKDPCWHPCPDASCCG